MKGLVSNLMTKVGQRLKHMIPEAQYDPVTRKLN